VSKLTAGVYDMPDTKYHADPAPRPSLSSSLAKILLSKSPRHAWLAHPRLNKRHMEETAAKFNVGSAAHALLLEGEDAVAVIDADSFRSKEARAARDAAYEAGKIPLLAAQALDVKMMHEAALEQIKVHREASDVFAEGKPEQTLVWQEPGGIWCRARVDWLKGNGDIWDYKTTTSAHPDDWERRLFDLDGDLQHAWYRRGVRALGLSENPRFRFILQEVSDPYALSVVDLMPAAQVMGDTKVNRALEIWRDCLKRNYWPGYSDQTYYIEPPVWRQSRVEEAKILDDNARAAGKKLTDGLIDWQAPLSPKEAA